MVPGLDSEGGTMEVNVEVLRLLRELKQPVDNTDRLAKGGGVVGTLTLAGVAALALWVWNFRGEVLTPGDLEKSLAPILVRQEGIREDVGEIKDELRVQRERAVPVSVLSDIESIKADIRALQSAQPKD